MILFLVGVVRFFISVCRTRKIQGSNTYLYYRTGYEDIGNVIGDHCSIFPSFATCVVMMAKLTFYKLRCYLVCDVPLGNNSISVNELRHEISTHIKVSYRMIFVK